MAKIDPLSAEAQAMMGHRIRREVERQLEGNVTMNYGEPPIYRGPDPLASPFLGGFPISLPRRNPSDPIRLRWISWEEFKGIRRYPCCGDYD